MLPLLPGSVMTKIALLAALALCAAPQLMIAADAQTARAPATANARAPHVPSAAEMAAQRKQICQDGYAHAIGDLAYLEARLNLTPAQQPLFDHWKSVKIEIARRDMADCTTREIPRLADKPPTLLDSMAREQETLKHRLADLDAEIPVLGAFYNVLTQAQKDAWDHPGQQAMMMSRFRNFGPGMPQRMNHSDDGPGGPGGNNGLGGPPP